jgi:hypothetical protein
MGRDDTHNRHQHTWTLLDSGGPDRPLRARPQTVLDISAMLCKQGVNVLSSPRSYFLGRQGQRKLRGVKTC